MVGKKLCTLHLSFLHIPSILSPHPSKPSLRVHPGGRGREGGRPSLNHARWKNYEEDKRFQSLYRSINSKNTRVFERLIFSKPSSSSSGPSSSPSRVPAISHTSFDDDDVNPPCPGWVQRTSKATTPLPTLGGNVHHHLHPPSISPSPTDLATYLPTYLPPPTTLDRPPSLRTL